MFLFAIELVSLYNERLVAVQSRQQRDCGRWVEMKCKLGEGNCSTLHNSRKFTIISVFVLLSTFMFPCTLKWLFFMILRHILLSDLPPICFNLWNTSYQLQLFTHPPIQNVIMSIKKNVAKMIPKKHWVKLCLWS